MLFWFAESCSNNMVTGLSRCDVTTCGMRASTNQGTDKREKSRMHTESKIQRNNNASRRGQTNTASRRGQKDTVSRRDGTTLPLAEAGTLSLAEIEQHCLSQRRKGKQGKNKLLFPHRGTRDTFELIRICWTLTTKRREQGCLPIDSQLIGHFPPKRQTLPRVSRLYSGSL